MFAFINNKWIEFFTIIQEKHGKYTYSYINNNIKINNLTKIKFICEICNKEYIVQYKNYKNKCKNCLTKETLKKYNITNVSQLDEIKKKKKETCMKNYGVDNPIKSEIIQEKIKQTNLQKYGQERFININKREQTNLQKYGVKHGLSDIKIRKKIEQTNLKKYNTKIPVSFGSTKFKQIIQKKYGVEYASQNKKVKEKTKQTILNRYDVENISHVNLNKRINHLKINAFNNINYENIVPMFTQEEYLKIRKEKYSMFKWKCLKCGTEFEDYYANGIMPRCPTCFPKLSGHSIYEYEIIQYLSSYTIIHSDRSIIPPYEVDIYLPDYKLAIEFNGLYWHSIKFINDKYYHQNKVKLANEKGIRLLHIWEHEWIEEKDLIKEVIDYYINNLNEEIKPEEPKLYNIYDNLIWV